MSSKMSCYLREDGSGDEHWTDCSPTAQRPIRLSPTAQRPVRSSSIHINPSLLTSSHSLHINKKLLHLNQNTTAATHSNYPEQNVLRPSQPKIHYNPKFLKAAENMRGETVNSSHGMNIHINSAHHPPPPSNPTLPPNNVHVQKQNIHFKWSSHPSTLHPIPSHTSTLQPTHSQTSTLHRTHSETSRLLHPTHSETSRLHPTHSQTSRLHSSHSQTSRLHPTHSETSSLHPTHAETSRLHPTHSGSAPQRKNVTISSSKYKKVNTQPVPKSKMFAVSRYKIQRKSDPTRPDCLPVAKQLPPRKPKLSGSFKQIGKRKLVRKSMIEKYISSRRCPVPSTMQRSRNIITSRLKLNKTLNYKYKYVRYGANKSCPLLKINNVTIPAKSKLKWSRPHSNSQEFVKIGRRKIVRKSILQSILEARRRTLYSLRKKTLTKEKHVVCGGKTTQRSRFKVTRKTPPVQLNSQHQLYSPYKRDSSVNTARKKDDLGLKQVVTSRSILLRMPPTLRLRLRYEEKLKRSMLLKKVNRIKCSFYSRFGYCKGLASGSCNKLHDSKSVAICQKFLKGICSGEGCSLSHKVVAEKMPTCHQFLAGVCVRPSCPFLHVKLAKTQPVCISFLQGFCSNADLCLKRHQFVCPEWDDTGSCTKEKCCFPHPQSNFTKPNSKPSNKEPTVGKPDKMPSPLQDETTSEEPKSRYFVVDTSGSEQTVNTMIAQRKPDLKDGINSVYDDQSLMTFIPFS